MIDKLTDEQRDVLEALPSGRKANRIIDQLQAALDAQFDLTQQALKLLVAAVERAEKAGGK